MSASVKRTSAKVAQTAEQIEQRLQQRWFDLTQAEDEGKGTDILAALFARYMDDLEALIAARNPSERPPPRRANQPHVAISA